MSTQDLAAILTQLTPSESEETVDRVLGDDSEDAQHFEAVRMAAEWAPC